MTREAGRTKRKRGASWTYKPLTFDELPAAVERARHRLKESPEFIAQRERLGIERALIYKLAVTTGLRKSELASLTIGQLDLDEDFPHVTLNAADEKNRQGNSIPLRRDVADELRQWVSSIEAGNQRNTLSILNQGASNTSPTSKLFNVPEDLSKVFERDRVVAGIAKRDDRGRTVDVHALRHTFGTMLSKAGVPLRTAQAAMRHSDPKLTANVYTDPRLLDVQGAIEALPEFSSTSEPYEHRQRMAAGAETLASPAVTPTVTPNADFSGALQSTAVTLNAFPSVGDSENSLGCNVMAANEKRSLPTSSNERFTSEAGGTRTRNLRIDSPAGQSSNAVKPQRVAKRRSRRGSSGGSSSPENERGEVVGGSVLSRAGSLPIKADSFSAALAMIASLPLSDAERAECVRRLMAEQAGSPEKSHGGSHAVR